MFCVCAVEIQRGWTYGTKIRKTLFTTSTLTRKSITEALPGPLSAANWSVPEPLGPSVRDLAFCDVVRLSAKREEKMDHWSSPSFSRIKSAA